MQMQKKKNQIDQFLTRKEIVQLIIIAGFIGIVIKLIILQVFLYPKYYKIAGRIQFVRKEIPAQRGTIFDRNGRIVFETNNLNEGWNGNSFDNNPEPEQLYVYLLKITLINGNTYEKRGVVTLYR